MEEISLAALPVGADEDQSDSSGSESEVSPDAKAEDGSRDYSDTDESEQHDLISMRPIRSSPNAPAEDDSREVSDRGDSEQHGFISTMRIRDTARIEAQEDDTTHFADLTDAEAPQSCLSDPQAETHLSGVPLESEPADAHQADGQVNIPAELVQDSTSGMTAQVRHEQILTVPELLPLPQRGDYALGRTPTLPTKQPPLSVKQRLLKAEMDGLDIDLATRGGNGAFLNALASTGEKGRLEGIRVLGPNIWKIKELSDLRKMAGESVTDLDLIFTSDPGSPEDAIVSTEENIVADCVPMKSTVSSLQDEKTRTRDIHERTHPPDSVRKRPCSHCGKMRDTRGDNFTAHLRRCLRRQSDVASAER